MTDTEIKDRTANKCFAKINALENSLEYLAIQKPYFAYTREMIDAQISFKRRELMIWNHMALLNETTT